MSAGSLTGHLHPFSAQWSVKELIDSKLHIFQEMNCLVIVSAVIYLLTVVTATGDSYLHRLKRSGLQNFPFLLWGVFFKVQIQPGTSGSHCNG